MERTFTVYANMLDEAKKRLVRLAKKANKYNLPLSYSIGEEYPKKIDIWKEGERGILFKTKENYMVGAVDITINYEGDVKQNGWTVLAKVEVMPNTKTKLVQVFGETQYRKEWESIDMHCDHCGTNRRRNCVFMVQNENGEIRQVGKSCLKDYTGIDPASIISWAEVEDIFISEEKWTEGMLGRFSSRYFELEDVLGQAIESIQKSGYVKSEQDNSTKIRVWQALHSDEYPSKETMAKAKEIRQWLMTEEGQKEISFMSISSMAMLESGYVKKSNIGYVCYWPVAYQRYMDRIEEQKRRESADATSDYVGEVGKRVEVKVANIRCLANWDSAYGLVGMYRIQDQNGNVYTWKTSSYVKMDAKVITGTVKAHNEYRGTKQTELTRCKCSA